MAYDALTNAQVAVEARDHMNLAQNAAARALSALAKSGAAYVTKAKTEINTCENYLKSAMSRQDELIRRVTPVPAPVPAPVPTPAPSGWVEAASILPVPRTFATSDFLTTGAQGPIVPIGELSAMRITQQHVAISPVDPFFKVAVGEHTHDLFNRSNIPVSGEYADLIKSNNASGEGGLINATFYALGSLMVQDMNDVWHNLIARYSIFYYKHDRPENPIWSNPALKRADLPRGMKMLGGIRHYRTAAEWSKISLSEVHNMPVSVRLLQGWVGNPETVVGPPDRTWRFDDLLLFAKAGMHIQVNVDFPRYWNGKHVDAPNHVEHLQYFPSDTHSHVLPTLSTHAMYTLPDFPIKRIATSADVRPDGTLKGEPGREIHGYWWEGINDDVRETIHRSVFDTGRDGSNGNLQNGTMLKGPAPRAEKPLSVIVPAGQTLIV